MSNVELFKSATVAVKEQSFVQEEKEEYMSDMAHWCVVHATKYMPRNNLDGTMYIPSTAMVTNFNNPRNTVHVTLNHVVGSHGYGSWDDMPIVVLAPYNAVVEKNGNPAEVAGTDTYWSVNPDAGLRLPESTYVVQPDDNGPLFQIGESVATYKRHNYTEEEIVQIEAMMDEWVLETYNMYKTGDLYEWDIPELWRGDERVKQMYDKATDKKAFLRGVCEEERFDILTKTLRDTVVKKSMQQMGMRYVSGISDGSSLSQIIATVAESAGIPSNESNKGHAGSLFFYLEKFWQFEIYEVLNGTSRNNFPGILKTDVKSLYDVIEQSEKKGCVLAVIQNLVENKPIDFMELYEKAYLSYVNMQIEGAEVDLRSYEARLAEYKNGVYSNINEEEKNKSVKHYTGLAVARRSLIDNLSAKKTIADYDKNLSKVLRRICDLLSVSYNAWREKIVKEPGFEMLVQKLRSSYMYQNVEKSGCEIG